MQLTAPWHLAEGDARAPRVAGSYTSWPRSFASCLSTLRPIPGATANQPTTYALSRPAAQDFWFQPQLRIIKNMTQHLLLSPLCVCVCARMRAQDGLRKLASTTPPLGQHLAFPAALQPDLFNRGWTPQPIYHAEHCAPSRFDVPAWAPPAAGRGSYPRAQSLLRTDAPTTDEPLAFDNQPLPDSSQTHGLVDMGVSVRLSRFAVLAVVTGTLQ